MDIHTTNPVVENALKACNWGSLKIGTRVEVDGSKGTVVANPGNLTRYTVKFDDGKIEDANSLAPYFKVVNVETAEEPVAKNAENYFKVGDIVTFKPFGRYVKFRVVSEYPTNDGNGQMLTVESYKGGFKDHSVRFEKA